MKLKRPFITLMTVLAGVLVFVIPAASIQETEQPAPPAPHHMRFRYGSATAAKLIYSVYPEYPKEAKKKHLEGDVRIRFVVGADGAVAEAVALSGNPILASAAVGAVRQWRYQPTLVNDEPVAVQTEVEVHFHRHKWVVD